MLKHNLPCSALASQRAVEAGEAGVAAEDGEAVIDAGADAFAGDGDAEGVDDVADFDALLGSTNFLRASSSGPISNGSTVASTARNFFSSSLACGGATRF